MTTPHDSEPRELPRDAWLSEALRHAPDADAAPPAALREAILRQARAAAAAGAQTKTKAAPRLRPSGAWQRLSNAWSWLSGPRVAAGFASLMVAAVIGLMWWDRPIDEALRPPEPTPAPAAISAAPPATPSPAAPASDMAPRTSQPTTAKATPAPSPAPRTEARAETPRAANAEARRENAAKAAAAPPPAATADAAVPRSRDSGAAAAATGALAARSFATTDAPASWRALLLALRDDPQPWRWQLNGGPERSPSPAFKAWLQRLDRAVAGRWRSAPEGAAADSATTELRLLRDGALQATLRLTADGRLQVDAPDGPPLIAQLPMASAAALQRGPEDGGPSTAPR